MDEVTGPVVRPRVAAGVLFLDDQDRVLLVVPSYKPFLDLPGGFVEPGEMPSSAAAREVREELGIAVTVGRLLVADWRQDSADGDGGPKLLLVFDGGRISLAEEDQIVVDGEEVVGYGYQEVAEPASSRSLVSSPGSNTLSPRSGRQHPVPRGWCVGRRRPALTWLPCRCLFT